MNGSSRSASTSPRHAAGAESTEQMENIKDTLESLVVAFILAFVFRGFLVEAFVIPTGSMAPTLYGEHGTQICPDCGWEYAFGLPKTGTCLEQIKCPNCERASLAHSEIPYHRPGSGCSLQAGSSRSELDRHMSIAPQSGDRILVFKWPYDLGGRLLGPQPWDVVVFKNPAHQGDNYIKRLVGMPNEVLEIIDGDIYTCPLSELDPAVIGRLEQAVQLKHEQLQERYVSSSERGRTIRGLQRDILQDISDKLRIRRKTDTAQSALWQVVFHQDFLHPPDGERPRWRALDVPPEGSAWDTTTPLIRFDGLQAAQQAIRFSGKQVGDYYSYNFTGRSKPVLYHVGDLRIKCLVHYEAGAGALKLRLSKGRDLFVAEFNPQGEVVLKHARLRGNQFERVGSLKVISARQLPAWQIERPIDIEFANVDYRVSVKVAGREILATTDQDYYPDLEVLRQRSRSYGKQPLIEISADHLDLGIAHLALDRDVYYRSKDPEDRRRGWGTTTNPIYLRAEEYFVLGDNSPASQDSRLWDRPGRYLEHRGLDYQVGTVKHDQMIGRAFFVYWPSGYRIQWLPVLKNFGLIPDVGKMRWIR